MHDRFKRKVWVTKNDLTGALAKWLVIQSPYTVPDNLPSCLEKFEGQLYRLGNFDRFDMLELELVGLTQKVYSILQTITDINSLNIPKNPAKRDRDIIFISRYSKFFPSDDDFIDILAVAQNIICELADRADATEWCDHCRKHWSEKLLDMCSPKLKSVLLEVKYYILCKTGRARCSNYGIFPNGVKCFGCGDCK